MTASLPARLKLAGCRCAPALAALMLTLKPSAQHSAPAWATRRDGCGTPDAEQTVTTSGATSPPTTRAPRRVWMRGSASAARLANHPKLGRLGKIAGTRELIPHESYRLVYELDNETVWLLTLVHTAWQWPPLREEGQLWSF